MLERFNMFTVLVANLTRNIRKIKTEEMAKFDLKSHHVSCIYYLYLHKTLTAKKLCDICHEDKANVSRAIEYLENNGYIEFEEENSKRYNSRFHLTEKGEAVGAHVMKRAENILEIVGENLDDENRKIMYESLTLINNNLQKIIEQYTK